MRGRDVMENYKGDVMETVRRSDVGVRVKGSGISMRNSEGGILWREYKREMGDC